MPTPEDLNDTMPSNERTPLLETRETTDAPTDEDSTRKAIYAFLEAKTPAGARYEKCMISLIFFNVFFFVVGTLFVEEYNKDIEWAQRGVVCGNTCDALVFGNFADNGLGWLRLGKTSVLEIVTVLVFTVEYGFRFYTADLENPKYAGWEGRLRWIPSFFSAVDLASTVPFYIDALLLDKDLAASSFLRMFRLLRMMRVEGRYENALTLMDDVWDAQKGILLTAGFVGLTTWMVVSSLYYLAERRNMDMIYCAVCADGHDLDPSKDCTMDDWGLVDCPDCTGCYNLYESIPQASYYSLLNLFGEFPHIDAHSWPGKVVGTITAVVAVAVFALPVGIIGNGLEDAIQSMRNVVPNRPIEEAGGITRGFNAAEDRPTSRAQARLYNLLHAHTAPGSVAFEWFINGLVIATSLSFMLDTLVELPPNYHVALDVFELVSVTTFTVEYILRVYSSKQDPKYSGPAGRFKYMMNFLSLVDLVAVLPYWIEVCITRGESVITHSASKNTWSNAVKALRLFRIFRFERYTHAFLTFDDVFARYADVLTVTLFSAVLVWIFFSACLYFSERDSLDAEMADNYKTIPSSMWITLLNLSGEAPLSQYSLWGKVCTAILGLIATGIFGIPIGVLGAGFEEILEEEHQDNTEVLETRTRGAYAADASEEFGSSIEKIAYRYVNGIGSYYATCFELNIYSFILLSVAVGAWQTVEGQENAFYEIEWIAICLFTLEYLIRLVGAGADPEFAKEGRNGFMCRVHFILSFYSIVDLMAIVPFYVSVLFPNSIVNDYDEYLRMIRIVRLIKLDKYIPSITLIGTFLTTPYRNAASDNRTHPVSPLSLSFRR